jgi:TPR repeat protein
LRKDLLQSIEYYTKASKNGHAEAMYNLGIMYELGEGVTRDIDKAVKWFKNANQLGFDKAEVAIKNINRCDSNGVDQIEGVPNTMNMNRKEDTHIKDKTIQKIEKEIRPSWN